MRKDSPVFGDLSSFFYFFVYIKGKFEIYTMVISGAAIKLKTINLR